MRSIITCAAAAAFLASLCLPARGGDLIGRQGENWARLSEAPCANSLVIARIPEAERKHWHLASAVFQGRSYEACWRMVGGDAYLLYDDGDQGVIPASDLRPASDV